MHSHCEVSNQEEQDYIINSCIAYCIIDDLMFDPEDAENKSNGKALHIFKASSDTNTYILSRLKTLGNLYWSRNWLGLGQPFA